MVIIPHSRILVGPLDGHLSNQAVRDMFSPYGEVLAGGYYHHIASTHSTYGFVEMDSENSAKRAIQDLIDGRFTEYGKRIEMTQCESAGPLPMRMNEWHKATFWSSSECETDGVDGGEATDVNTETPSFVKPTKPTDTSARARKFQQLVAWGVKLGKNAAIETDRDSSVHFPRPRRKTMRMGSKKRKDAWAVKMKYPALSFEEVWWM